VWLGQTAIPSIAPYARVSTAALDTAARRLVGRDNAISTTKLSSEFEQCEREQPALAQWLGHALASPTDDAARGLGASLAITIWNAFRGMAPDRLRRLTEEDFDAAEQLLVMDEQLRRTDAKAVLESDDVIALHQPDITRFMRARLEETMAHYADEIDVDDVDAVYRMLLVQVLALSYAVRPPEHLAAGAQRDLS